MRADFAIEPLSKKHRKDGFDCGEERLNQFLKLYAGQNTRSGLGKTFVAVRPGESEVLGYYTLSSGSISFEVLPEKMPRYPIPVAHLGRLAVNRTARGQKLGELLLVEALERIVSASAEIGIYAVELYALTDTAKRFYLKYGFAPLKDDARHLYIPLETIRQSLLSKS